MKTYKYAAVIQLTESDPVNSLEEGDIFLVAGKHEDGHSYTVLDEEAGDIVDIECEVIKRLEADYRMPKEEIVSWAAEQERAREAAAEANA